MSSNILNHNRTPFVFIPSKSDYWDVHPIPYHGGDGIYGDNLQEDCLAAYIDTTIDDCTYNLPELVSTSDYIWELAVNNGLELNNIGFTGVDNGYILYNKKQITDEEFMDIFTNSTLVLDADDKRLHVNPVGGNNGIYSYPCMIVTEDGMRVAKLQGGFYQGFFQAGDGCDYKVLPLALGKGWTMEFTLKPEEFKSDYQIRREKYSVIEYNSDGWDGYLGDNSPYTEDYTSDNYVETTPKPTLNDIYPDNAGIFFYMGTRAENKWWKYYTDADLETDLETYDGIPLDENVATITTDNKFITYHRTRRGLKAFMKDRRDDPAVIEMQKNLSTDNYFIIMHRGKGGYTARSIKELRQQSNAKYDILGDLYRNAMAFQIKPDGSVGYKFMVKDCDAEEGYSIKEEWSYPGIVTNGVWHTITVRVRPVVKYANMNGNYNPQVDYMRLMFYVDGKLVLYSKEIPTIMLRALNDEYSKQEGVPYNISLGGGTQGLCDVIYENYKDIPDYVLYLEKEFGGSFNGYFKSFRFYDCDKNFNEIGANIRFERNLFKKAGVPYYLYYNNTTIRKLTY